MKKILFFAVALPFLLASDASAFTQTNKDSCQRQLFQKAIQTVFNSMPDGSMPEDNFLPGMSLQQKAAIVKQWALMPRPKDDFHDNYADYFLRGVCDFASLYHEAIMAEPSARKRSLLFKEKLAGLMEMFVLIDLGIREFDKFYSQLQEAKTDCARNGKPEEMAYVHPAIEWPRKGFYSAGLEAFPEENRNFAAYHWPEISYLDSLVRNLPRNLSRKTYLHELKRFDGRLAVISPVP